jgi:hypothetical protein
MGNRNAPRSGSPFERCGFVFSNSAWKLAPDYEDRKFCGGDDAQARGGDGQRELAMVW